MTDQTQDWLQEQPAATLILAAYSRKEAQLPKRSHRADTAATPEAAVPAEAVADAEDAASEAENAEAWVPRIGAVEGVDAAVLSTLHGGLIARGYLKYELFVRQGGLRYRLTPEGRKAAEAAASVTTGAVDEVPQTSAA